MAGSSEATSDEGARVFLSYRREDTGRIVARLVSDLAAALGEGQVFYDRESLRPGELWPERLRAAVQGAEVVVALIGTGWVQARVDDASGMRRLDDPGDWVRLELETALDEARTRPLRIVPVLVDGAEMPDERSRLPDAIKAITQHQALALRTATEPERAADVAKLLAVLGADGRQSRDDTGAAEWIADHLQRVVARVAQRRAASAPVQSGEPAPRHVELSLVERPFEARREASAEALSREVSDLQQLASRERARILVVGEGGAGKTASLLHVAAVAAERAGDDPAAPIPVYVDLAQLMQIDDVRDLVQLVADAAPPDSEGVSLHSIAAHRPCLFLFDSFNEVPEQLHRNCVVALRRFVDTWGDHHRYIVGSRAVPGVEPLTHPPSSFTAYSLLRLTAEQVASTLGALGLAALHEHMPQELRDLARNPFMLVAIARTLAGTAEHDLPRNRGKLYQRVVETWMANEAAKRHLEYSFERVKAPVLSYLAARMTAAGQTSLAWRELEPEIEQLLEATHQRIRRRGGMPDDWTVDGCRDEIVADDVLQQTGDRVTFRHQSFQEYFAACWFAAGRADALVELTPRLVWSLVSTRSAMDVPCHRLVPVLTMMVGLVEDSTELVEVLAERHPVIAAAAMAAASRVDPAAQARLEQRWIEMLRDDVLRRRVVACSCLSLVARSPGAVRALVEFALDGVPQNTYVGAAVLPRVNAADELATQLVEAILALDDERYARAEWRIGTVLGQLPIPRLVVFAFEHWRAVGGDAARRSRLEAVLATTVDRARAVAQLREISADTIDAARAADASRALADMDGWNDVGLLTIPSWIRQLPRLYNESYVAQRDREAARLREADGATLEAALARGRDTTRAGAARVIADRRMPLGDAVVAALLRDGSVRSRRELVAVAVDLLGAAGAIAKLVEASHRDRVWLRHLDASALAPLPGWKTPDDSLSVSIRHHVALAVATVLGGPEAPEEYWVTPSGNGRSWLVAVHSDARPRYEVSLSPDGLELYDRAMCVTAIRALADIGPAALAALREAAEREEPTIRSAAITGLARLGDPELAGRLLGLLRTLSDPALVDTALEALVKLRPPQAIALVDDLLGMTEDGSDVHPVWGRCRSRPGWSDAIHRILVAIAADREVAAAIDAALATGDADRRRAALRELSRWLSDDTLEPERAAAWKPARGDQLVALALHDPAEPVRREGASALRHVSSSAVVEAIARALDGGDPAVQLEAARALLDLDAPDARVRVPQVLLAIATEPGPQALRRAAGRVLAELPGGLASVHDPIQAALGRGDPQAALDLIADALEIVPDDINLLWWRGRAQNALGQRAQAAASLRRAFELRDPEARVRQAFEREDPAAEIPPVLAELLIDLGDFAGAVPVARRGVELSRYSADAHALLAWSCYRANATVEGVSAARTACDLDPVHPRAMWILILALLRAFVPGEAREATDHALRVRELLSPGLDTSFLATFTEELGELAAADEATAQLVAELRQRLAAPVQSSL